jgi:hypothetical protein
LESAWCCEHFRDLRVPLVDSGGDTVCSSVMNEPARQEGERGAHGHFTFVGLCPFGPSLIVHQDRVPSREAWVRGSFANYGT